MIDLKPCPFCGYKAELQEGGDRDMNATIPSHFVQCKTCWAQGPKFSEYHHTRNAAKAGAIQFWNQRVNEVKT